MTLEIIQHETDDQINLVEGIGDKGVGYLFIVCGIVIGVLAFPLDFVIVLPTSVLFILMGLYPILASGTVTFDKKSQSVVIKKDSHINLLKSANEIPFANVKKIEIVKSINYSFNTWYIRLITMQENIVIYSTNSESEVEILGEKICKMISCKEISHDISDDRGFGY